MGRDTRGALTILSSVLSPLSPGPDTGANTLAWVATSPDVEGSRFFVKRKQVETAPHTTDAECCDRLWNESARLTGLPQTP
ncbi:MULTISPECIES: hypothetical protein [unclassified Streptomyces]|uniref:hypothetical protein n=1 Tax=unclassified Streptomyces TaxID=2593676 RepID=UPI003D908149